eukprot:TRINITY_DN91_c0_g4_i1.p1 TRINITY_DN91_c0_g4~~TRINITY_DN91_c0_g4_i1.p1  ORF type:complete len:1789 (-),score=168.64 TRINITY_DN91_c0_g4_i1:127-5493(-)
MLNNMDDEEAKIILIKLLGVLGKSLENKVIIGRNDGFRKLLGLMLEQNEDLLKGIIDAFKQILDITPEKDDVAAAANKVGTPEIGSLSAAEIRSLFEPLQDECSPGNRSTKSMVVNNPGSRPSFDALKRMSIELKTEEDKSTAGRVSDGGARGKSRMTCLTLFKNYEEDKHPFEEAKSDVVAEEMVIQGTLGTLKDILLTTKRDLQIDLMQIIARLLVKSTYNQAEFQQDVLRKVKYRKIEGYFVLAVMLNQKRDCGDVNERRYLRTCMQILKTIIYNGDENKVIKNAEAFKVLLSLISSSQQLLTISEALVLLNEILGTNARNCLIFLKMLGFVDLHVLLLRLLFPESEYDNLIKTEFCKKNNIAKLSLLCSYYYVRREETINSQTFGENVKKVTECFEAAALLEKDKIELFTLTDNLIMSLSCILNPLHIMPCAQMYSHILSCPQVPIQFYKCLLDRLEVMILEKLTKVNVQDYEHMYCSDLEQTLSCLAKTLYNAYNESDKSVTMQELFTNVLDIYHKFLLFTAVLQVCANGSERSHLSATFEALPGILDFIYGLLETAFVNNPYYTELIYSVLELMVCSALPCEPVVNFVKMLLSKSGKWKYQDLLLLDSGLGSSPAICEAVASSGLLNFSQEKLAQIFIVYVLCRDSVNNKVLLESQIKPLEFVKELKYEGLGEKEQLFVMNIFRSLVNFARNGTVVDYSVLIPGMNPNDAELINNIRNEMKTGYQAVIDKAIPKEACISTRPQLMNLRNTFMTLLLESSPSVQSTILSAIVNDLNNSIILCNEWMHSEVIDSLLEVYSILEESMNPLKNSYLSLISKILGRGVSLSKPDLFYKLLESSSEFRQTILSILEAEDLPFSLRINKQVEPEADVSGLYTAPMKSFPRERVGFSVSFWAKFSAVMPFTTLFELVETKEKEKLVFSCKYVVEVIQPKKEDENAPGSGRGSARGEMTKHYFCFETEGVSNRIEMEIPLLNPNKLTHVVVHYSKNAGYIYINGKQVCCTKAGTQNPYPMAFVKNLRLKLTSQAKTISPVTLYEGAIDPKAVANLWLKGPLEEYINTQKELGIDLAKVYKFPKPAKDSKVLETSIDKLSFDKAEGYQCRNYPFTISTALTCPQYLANLKYPVDSEYQTPNTKNFKLPEQFYEATYSTQIVQSHTFTLKEFLSTPELAKILLSKLSRAESSEFAVLLHILKLLLIRNERFVAALKDLRIPSVLLSLALARKDISSDQQYILGTVLDLLCAQQNTLKDLNVFSKPNLLLVPVLHQSRFEYFKALQYLMIVSSQSQRECILNVLSNLLIRQENANKLSGEGLQPMLFYMLKEICDKRSDSDNFMYEKLLEVLQLFFHWHHVLNWDLLFSFFLLLKNKEASAAQDVLTDLLSILSVYMFVSSNKCALAEKFVAVGGVKVLFYAQMQHFLQMIYSLIDSKSIAVVEHAVKLLATLMLANGKLKPNISKVKGFEVLSHRLSVKTPTFSFLQTLLDFVVGGFKVQTLYPQTNSYVSTVINRSPIAGEVLNQVPPSQLGLVNPEMLETLFSALSRTKELHYRINMLRQLETVVVTGTLLIREYKIEHDAQKVIDAGIFVWIVEYFKNLEVEQQKVTKDVVAESIKKISKMSIKILCGIITKELEKTTKNCKLIKLLQSIPSVDHIQMLVLNRLLKNLCKENALKKEPDNVIKNIAAVLFPPVYLLQLFSNSLHTILTVTDDLKFKLVRVINVLASKNTTEVRSQMKKSGLRLTKFLLLYFIKVNSHSVFDYRNQFFCILRQIESQWNRRFKHGSVFVLK